jgi:hypothetical protein
MLSYPCKTAGEVAVRLQQSARRLFDEGSDPRFDAFATIFSMPVVKSLSLALHVIWSAPGFEINHDYEPRQFFKPLGYFLLNVDGVANAVAESLRLPLYLHYFQHRSGQWRFVAICVRPCADVAGTSSDAFAQLRHHARFDELIDACDKGQVLMVRADGCGGLFTYS